MDMSKTIAPKSDQLNFDDLISGPMTIKITVVRAGSSPEQPVSVFFEGDNGKPYKPCKSMRRLMVAVWGADATQYGGRSMTLFGDPEVKFGGMKVGGIRVSHMSHIDRDVMVPLTIAKSRRAPYVVKPLRTQGGGQGGSAGGGGQGGADQHSQSAQRQNEGAGGDIDIEKLIAQATSTAAGGLEVYRQWFEGLGVPRQKLLKETTRPDSDDFDQPKPVHEICKDIALAEDKKRAGSDDF